MKHISRSLSLLAASLMLALGLAVVPVGAEHGVNAETTDSTTTSTTTSDTSNDTSGSHDTTSTETESSSSDGGSLHDQAKLLLDHKRQSGKEHSETERQNACTERQKSIDTRTGNFGTAAQRHLDVFNGIFTKVQAFHDSKGLNVTNYDALVAAATAKQTAAQTAVDALKALNVKIDCTQPDPAGTVATIKTAVSDARTALQAYRKSLVDLITALKGASTADHSTSDSTTTTTGGTQ